jgi:hypothetical protein
MKINNDLAIEFGRGLRQAFLKVDFYIPADHDEFVLIAYIAKYLSEDQILAVDCEIVQRCNILIAYSPDGYLSSGMRKEIAAAEMASIPVIQVPDLSPNSLGLIHRQLWKFMR